MRLSVIFADGNIHIEVDRLSLYEILIAFHFYQKE
jgi:hypothetical protein